MASKEFVAASRTDGGRILVETAAIVRHAATHANFDVACAARRIAAEADVKRA